MKTYKIARTDLVVSRLAFGCAMLGLASGADFSSKVIPVIQTAYDQGVTFFDTADFYGSGDSETALGKVLKDSPGMRHRVVIQSKCGDSPEGADNSFKHIMSSVEGSLRRLGTDHLDLLLLHWPDSLVQPEDVARAFDDLKERGKVRYFGVSNHSPAQYELLQKSVRQPLVTNQIQLGLMHWDVTQRDHNSPLIHADGGVTTVDYCRVHDIWVQAYSPLRSDTIGSAPSPLMSTLPADAPSEVKRTAHLLAEVAKKYDATPAAIMLAWLLRHPAGITPILGTTNAEHLVQNCVSDRLELTREEWYKLLSAASKNSWPGLF